MSALSIDEIERERRERQAEMLRRLGATESQRELFAATFAALERSQALMLRQAVALERIADAMNADIDRRERDARANLGRGS